MILLVLGILLLVMKYFEFGPVGAWPWWLVMVPFVLTPLWWWYADASGLNKRREMDKMEDRKARRRSESLERLNLKDPTARGKAKLRGEKAHAMRQREIEKVEGKRAEQRSKNRDSLLRSRFDPEQSMTRPSQVNTSREANPAPPPRAMPMPMPTMRLSDVPEVSNEGGGIVDPPEAGFPETVPLDYSKPLPTVKSK